MLGHLCSIEPISWLCFGDFNETLVDEEKWGRGRKARWQMENFRKTLATCHLEDLGYIGPNFTWCNKQAGSQFIKERLDRVLANPQWQDMHPCRCVTVLALCSSDHVPVHVCFSGRRGRNRRALRQFRYEVAWNKKDVEHVIKKVWRRKKNQASGWVSIVGNLNNSRESICRWDKANKDPTKNDILKKLVEVEELHDRNGEWDLGRINQLQTDAQNLMEKVDLKWRQRAKEAWLMHRDKNSKYFHACSSQRRRRNFISSILDSKGDRQDTQAGIEEAFVEHFKDTLFTSGPRGMEECLSHVLVKVTAEMNCNLLGEVSADEVKNAVSQMAHMKSPGPDGFPAAFY